MDKAVVGKYKLTKVENLDEVFKRLEYSKLYRKICQAALLLPRSTEITYNSETEMWSYKNTVGINSVQFSFKIGIPFDEKLFDGRIVKTVITEPENNVWEQVQTFSNGAQSSVRWEFDSNEGDLNFVVRTEELVANLKSKKIN